VGHPAVRTVIPGAVTAAEVEANVAVFSRKLPTSLWSDLKTAGLLRQDAPVPEENA
jgi:D-threo-aldose 1-dehydrogenase